MTVARRPRWTIAFYLQVLLLAAEQVRFQGEMMSLRAKYMVYNGLILSILLYGAETWSLTKVLFNRMRTFHVQCVRTMCLVTKRQMWKEHISTKSLELKLGMQSIDVYVYRRQLAWVGHVSRIGFERMPRKLLSSWINHRQPRGGVEMTYGRGLGKAFRYACVLKRRHGTNLHKTFRHGCR